MLFQNFDFGTTKQFTGNSGILAVFKVLFLDLHVCFSVNFEDHAFYKSPQRSLPNPKLIVNCF